MYFKTTERLVDKTIWDIHEPASDDVLDTSPQVQRNLIK